MGTGIKHCSLMMRLAKALQNPKWNELFFEPFKGHEFSKNKIQWLDLTCWLWPLLEGFPFAKMIYTHFIVIMQFLRLPFSFLYLFHSWFNQFERSLNMDMAISQLPLADILSKP
jgi:hypothetical protein